ncbi:hypothetical protein ZIOFF_049875 [Zingiber officinale]|uniref:Uncharacterized protein n=1 Tax=Zingiber officinale TaxID=94328 RepID=A0A8J5KTA1_ZINOF|nr:hypothetical protein ZIOFF_049875 [Zingiber officinale]
MCTVRRPPAPMLVAIAPPGFTCMVADTCCRRCLPPAMPSPLPPSGRNRSSPHSLTHAVAVASRWPTPSPLPVRKPPALPPRVPSTVAARRDTDEDIVKLLVHIIEELPVPFPCIDGITRHITFENVERENAFLAETSPLVESIKVENAFTEMLPNHPQHQKLAVVDRRRAN